MTREKKINNPSKETNWYVITGGPGSGKTTTIDLLQKKGYKTTIEYARHYIDTQRVTGKTVEEIRQNQVEFQSRVLEMQMQQELALDPGETVFLDRALPDALAYYRFLHLPLNPTLQQALKEVSYKKIFILECLPLINDYARVENAQAQKDIHALIREVYESLPFPIVNVPLGTPEERVALILNSL